MKKIIFPLLLLILITTSCTFNEETSDTYWKVVNVTIDSEDWVRYTDNHGLNPYYACEVDMPEITPYVYNSGLVQVNYAEGTSTNRFQENLPYVRHYEDDTNVWTTTIDCAYKVGTMTFFVTHSDFAAIPPSDMKFRVVMLW